MNSRNLPNDMPCRKRALWSSSLCIALLLALSACSSVQGKFENSLTEYNDMLRWHKLEEASSFTSEALSDEFLNRVKAAKNMKIFDYRILRKKYDEAKKEAEVRVQIDYYILSTNTLKSLVDVQKWAYIKENGSEQWRLMSLLPEFK